MDILPEEDPFAVPVKDDGDRAGRVTRGMETEDLLFFKLQHFPHFIQLVVHGGGGKRGLVPIGRRFDRVAFLHGRRVQGVGDDLTSGPLPQLGDSSDMVDMAMGGDHRGKRSGPEAQGFHILQKGRHASPGAGVHHHQVSQVEEVDTAILGGGQFRRPDKKDPSMHFTKAIHTRVPS